MTRSLVLSGDGELAGDGAAENGESLAPAGSSTSRVPNLRDFEALLLEHQERFRVLPTTVPSSFTIAIRPYCPFRVDIFNAADSARGYGTRIRSVFVGNVTQYYFPEKGPYTADFRISQSLDVCMPIVDIVVVIDFEADCEWSCSLTGRAIKRREDVTTEQRRARAIQLYEADELRRDPSLRDDPVKWARFQEMLRVL